MRHLESAFQATFLASVCLFAPNWPTLSDFPKCSLLQLWDPDRVFLRLTLDGWHMLGREDIEGNSGILRPPTLFKNSKTVHIKTTITKELTHPEREGSATHFTGEDIKAFHLGFQTSRVPIFP